MKRIMQWYKNINVHSKGTSIVADARYWCVCKSYCKQHIAGIGLKNYTKEAMQKKTIDEKLAKSDEGKIWVIDWEATITLAVQQWY